MQILPLIFEGGHPFVALEGGRFLVDTGAPNSFGKVSPVTLEGQDFDLQHNYMGLTAETLSDFVGGETLGILGCDILNQFDILIDAPGSRVSLSFGTLECVGEELALDHFMGIPVLTATIGHEPARMFFDTGAQLSYFQGESLAGFPSEGSVTDFYPGFGRFATDTFRIPFQFGRSIFEVRCGQLPSLLGMTLMLAGVRGIVGNEVIRNRVAGYFPRSRRLVLS